MKTIISALIALSALAAVVVPASADPGPTSGWQEIDVGTRSQY